MHSRDAVLKLPCLAPIVLPPAALRGVVGFISSGHTRDARSGELRAVHVVRKTKMNQFGPTRRTASAIVVSKGDEFGGKGFGLTWYHCGFSFGCVASGRPELTTILPFYLSPPPSLHVCVPATTSSTHQPHNGTDLFLSSMVTIGIQISKQAFAV